MRVCTSVCAHVQRRLQEVTTLAYQDDAEQAGIRFNLILGTSQLKCLVLTLQSRHFLALRTVKEALELRSCLSNEGIYIFFPIRLHSYLVTRPHSATTRHHNSLDTNANGIAGLKRLQRHFRARRDSLPFAAGRKQSPVASCDEAEGAEGSEGGLDRHERAINAHEALFTQVTVKTFL